MENVVLGLLIIQSLTLYEMNQGFKQGLSMIYSASFGSMQTALKNLLAGGMVTFEERVDHGRNKKVFSITATGREAFFQWMAAETPLNKLEVVGLAKVYFLGLIPDVEQRKKIVTEILNKLLLMEDHLSGMNDTLKTLRVPEAQQEIFMYQIKTLDYGRGAHAFAREWFKHLLEDLE